MATFLQLCEDVASESRTGAFPGTVSGVTGRPAKIARWVREAWTEIQNDDNDWRWMEDRFTGSILTGQAIYEGSDFGLTRWGGWKAGRDPESGLERITLYETALGQSDERPLQYMPWSTFQGTYLRGASASRAGRPGVYTVDTAERFALWPTPEIAYTLAGSYRKSPQSLVANDDVPECPARFHSIIRWRALVRLAAHDEAFNQPGYWNAQYMDVFSDLTRDQLPKIRHGRAIA